MPVAERRFHLGMLLKQRQYETEKMEKINQPQSNGKGTRQKRISGEALKTQIKSGNVPMT